MSFLRINNLFHVFHRTFMSLYHGHAVISVYLLISGAISRQSTWFQKVKLCMALSAGDWNEVGVGTRSQSRTGEETATMSYQELEYRHLYMASQMHIYSRHAPHCMLRIYPCTPCIAHFSVFLCPANFLSLHVLFVILV